MILRNALFEIERIEQLFLTRRSLPHHHALPPQIDLPRSDHQQEHEFRKLFNRIDLYREFAPEECAVRTVLNAPVASPFSNSQILKICLKPY